MSKADSANVKENSGRIQRKTKQEHMKHAVTPVNRLGPNIAYDNGLNPASASHSRLGGVDPFPWVDQQFSLYSRAASKDTGTWLNNMGCNDSVTDALGSRFRSF